MLDSGSMAVILRSLMAKSLARLSPFPKWRLEPQRKTSGVRNKYRRADGPHRCGREIERHRRQLAAGQLDFTASGQPYIKGDAAERGWYAQARGAF